MLKEKYFSEKHEKINSHIKENIQQKPIIISISSVKEVMENAEIFFEKNAKKIN